MVLTCFEQGRDTAKNAKDAWVKLLSEAVQSWLKNGSTPASKFSLIIYWWLGKQQHQKWILQWSNHIIIQAFLNALGACWVQWDFVTFIRAVVKSVQLTVCFYHVTYLFQSESTLYGWVFVYELSVCGFESICSHLKICATILMCSYCWKRPQNFAVKLKCFVESCSIATRVIVFTASIKC